MAYRILTFDGGGIRGYFSALVLARLEAESGVKIAASADLIAGTSTGGIIALALARGLPAKDLAALYRDHGEEIFSDSWLDDVKDLGKVIGADYDNAGLRKLLEQKLGKQTTLGQLGTSVLIPTFDLDAPADGDRPRAWKPKFFHNMKGEGSDAKERAVDVALRTSAAPTFFPSWQGYVDGGVVANNPSMSAIAQALDRRYNPAPRRTIDDLVLLSISTGSEAKFIEGDELDWGYGQWAQPLVELMIGGVGGVAHFQSQQLLQERYMRLDAYFEQKVDLDSVGKESFAYMKKKAGELKLGSAIAWLGKQWG